MKRLSMLLAAVVTVCLVACGTQAQAPSVSPQPLATSASGAPAGDVDALMAQARTLAEKTNGLGLDLWEQGQMMEVVMASSAAAAKPELAKAKSMLDEITANQKSIASLLERVVQLDASEELTTYARQQKEIAGLQLLAIDAQYELLKQAELVYQEKGRIGEADLETLFATMAPSNADDPLAQLEPKGQASIEYFRQSGLPERYYINNGMGEAYDSSAVPSESEGFEIPIPVGGAVELWGADPMGGGGWKVRGSFKGSVAKAMQAERTVLEGEGWSVSLGPSGDTRGVMTTQKDDLKATLTFTRADPGQAGKLVIRLTGM